MKTKILIFACLVSLTACNNSTSPEQVKKIKDLASQDSTMAAQAKQKDSLITSYLTDLNDIQATLDQIKTREKIISMNSPEMNKNVAAQVKDLDEWIVKNDKRMNELHAKLRKMTTKDKTLESLVARLTHEVEQKDEEIADLQAKLSKADETVRTLTAHFNDSIRVIGKQRKELMEQTAEMNTVYYVTGTMKQLQEKGVIDKEGGFIGLGRVAELNPDVNNSMFTKANRTELKGISLNGKFRRLITVHPEKAYKITGSGKADSLCITMPATFWGESKYLIVATK